MFTRSKLAFAAPLISLGAMGMAAPAAAAPQEDSPWHGFYTGVTTGGAWSTADADAVLSVSPSAPIATHPITGGDVTAINGAEVKAKLPSGLHNTFTVGLDAGYNYVMGGGLLLGIETDVSLFNISRSGNRLITGPTGNTYTVHQHIDTDLLWTLRPRVGYVFDKFLIFGSGGLALTTTHYNLVFTDNQTGGSTLEFKKSGTRTGWTVGGGAGYALTPNVSLKAEYLYQDYGSSRYSTTSANGYVTLNTEAHLTSHLARAGIDYRF